MDDLLNIPADDLRIVTSECFDDDDGERTVCVLCLSIDAVTFVGADVERQLRARGVVEIPSLPDDEGPDTEDAP